MTGFDKILIELGQFGTYQKLLFLAFAIPTIMTAFQTMSVVFYMAEHPHRCAIPGFSNDTFEIQNEAHALLINGSIPLNEYGDGYAKCTIYQEQRNVSDDGLAFGNRREVKCDKWVYDRSLHEESIVSDMDFVCDRTALQSHATMIYGGGFLVSSLFVAPIADLYGRRHVGFALLLVFLVGTIPITWAPNFFAYVILRFFSAVGNMGYWLVFVTLGIEWTGPSYRHWGGMMMNMSWCIGMYLVCLPAYFLRNWRDYQLATSLPMVVLIAFWWIIPESPRWLVSQGKQEEAWICLQKAAKINKVKLTKTEIKIEESDNKRKGLATFGPLFTNRILLLRFLILCLNWFVINLGYYGLSLNVGKLGGDIYVNYTASATAELAAYIVAAMLSQRVGRKITHCGSLFLGGFACLATIFTTLYADKSLHWVTVTLSMIGKFGVCVSFGTIYLLTLELTPTVMRNFVMGITNVVGRFGTMMSPYIADLSLLVATRLGRSLPLVVFGAALSIGGLSAICFPETWKTRLPDTISDAIAFGRDPVTSPDPAVNAETGCIKQPSHSMQKDT